MEYLKVQYCTMAKLVIGFIAGHASESLFIIGEI